MAYYFHNIICYLVTLFGDILFMQFPTFFCNHHIFINIMFN